MTIADFLDANRFELVAEHTLPDMHEHGVGVPHVRVYQDRNTGEAFQLWVTQKQYRKTPPLTSPGQVESYGPWTSLA